MKYKLIAIVAVGVLGLSGTALAAQFLGGKGQSVDVPKSETHHNLYAAGNTVNIAGPVTGDLVAAGSSITISGNVQANLEVAGSNIVVNGTTGNNARVAGKDINLNGNIGGDVLAAGSKVRINGTVAGDVMVAARVLTFGPNAKVTGHIDYYGSMNPVIENGASVSTINHITPKAHDFKHTALVLHGFGTVVSFLAWLVACLALVWFFPKRTQAILNNISSKVWQNIGIGILGLIVFPIVVVLLFVALVGYFAAFIILFSWLTLLLVTGLLAALWLGAKILSWYKKAPLHANLTAAIVGVIVFKIAALIPIIGWLAVAVLCLVTFGAFLRYGFTDIKDNG